MSTICYACRHFKNLEPNSPRQDVWYNHICTASPRKQDKDPVTGRIMSVGVNAAGDTYYTEERFAYCRDINKGSCEKYGEKKRK